MSKTPESLIPYDTLVMEALRAVVRQAVQLASDEGLPGEHHFYLTFRTDHPLAEMPEAIRAKYPTEIRIVLQNQFSNLYVDDFGFHVTLYFGGMPTPLYVPFDAVTSFLDPHVQFSMRFDPKGLSAANTDAAPEAGIRVEEPKARSAQDQGATGEGNEADGKDDESGDEKGSDNVVNLSAFRKS